MRIVLAALGAVTVATSAPADYRTVATTTPAGSFRTGNPAAKVTLVEYLSFTCSHCADFFAAAKVPLHDGLVRQGKVAVETRAAVRDPYDLAAWSVARCGGPKRFPALAGAIFAQQATWTAKGDAYVQANLDKVRALPQRAQIRVVADQSGLSAIGARAGVTPAALTQCLANDVQLNQLLTMTDGAFKKIPGTPGFEINGKLVERVGTWDALAPLLAAAGAK